MWALVCGGGYEAVGQAGEGVRGLTRSWGRRISQGWVNKSFFLFKNITIRKLYIFNRFYFIVPK